MNNNQVQKPGWIMALRLLYMQKQCCETGKQPTEKGLTGVTWQNFGRFKTSLAKKKNSEWAVKVDPERAAERELRISPWDKRGLDQEPSRLLGSPFAVSSLGWNSGWHGGLVWQFFFGLFVLIEQVEHIKNTHKHIICKNVLAGVLQGTPLCWLKWILYTLWVTKYNIK